MGPISTVLICANVLCVAGCSEDLILRLFGGTAPEPGDPAVAVSEPATDISVDLGSSTTIRWADVAPDAGTIISVRAQRRSVDLDEALGAELVLLDGRDAQEDSDGDKFTWHVTGVRAGQYEIRVIISGPTGKTDDDVADGRIVVTTTLPVPTLTFTAPGSTDETFNPGDMFNITWTDNGSANASAKVDLGLDPDFNHTNGNEIFLLRGQALSVDGNTGSLTFTGVDANGNTIADGNYIVFATVDDGANDPTRPSAVGHLIIMTP